jgi:hypothetical protein
VVSICFEGRVHHINLQPGLFNKVQFERELRSLLHLADDEEIDVEFEVQLPRSAAQMRLHGMNAYRAAYQCAHMSAAARLQAAGQQGGSSISDAGPTGRPAEPGAPAAGAAAGAIVPNAWQCFKLQQQQQQLARGPMGHHGAAGSSSTTASGPGSRKRGHCEDGPAAAAAAGAEEGAGGDASWRYRDQGQDAAQGRTTATATPQAAGCAPPLKVRQLSGEQHHQEGSLQLPWPAGGECCGTHGAAGAGMPAGALDIAASRAHTQCAAALLSCSAAGVTTGGNGGGADLGRGAAAGAGQEEAAVAALIIIIIIDYIMSIQHCCS